MATDLVLPSGMAPSNLHLRSSVQAAYVEFDMFNIAERVKAISPRIHIFELTDEAAGEHGYSVMEHCDDGMERLIFRVGPGEQIDALDGRVVEKLRYLMAVPLKDRLDLLEAEEKRNEAQRKQDELDNLYENLGGPMRHELARCGFTGPLTVSAPLRNATARRHRNGSH